MSSCYYTTRPNAPLVFQPTPIRKKPQVTNESAWIYETATSLRVSIVSNHEHKKKKKKDLAVLVPYIVINRLFCSF